MELAKLHITIPVNNGTTSEEIEELALDIMGITNGLGYGIESIDIDHEVIFQHNKEFLGGRQ